MSAATRAASASSALCTLPGELLGGPKGTGGAGSGGDGSMNRLCLRLERWRRAAALRQQLDPTSATTANLRPIMMQLMTILTKGCEIACERASAIARSKCHTKACAVSQVEIKNDGVHLSAYNLSCVPVHGTL